MLKQVRSYEASDGTLFHDKVPALTHEAQISVLGVINSNGLGKQPVITSKDVARFIVQHAPAIWGVLRGYQEAVRRAGAVKKP